MTPPLQIATYYRPTAFYSDGVLGAAFESSFADSLDASVAPYDFYTEIGPEWPLPSPVAPPLGGFLSYYSYLESGVLREGMIAGFRPGYVPDTDFDTLFATGAVASIADVTEAEALAIKVIPIGNLITQLNGLWVCQACAGNKRRRGWNPA